MTSITVLLLVLAAVLLVIGGRQGIRILFGLALNFMSLLILLVLINWQFNPVIVTVTVGIVMLALAIYLGTDEIEVANKAFGVSAIVFIVLICLAFIVEDLGQFGGFAQENADELEGLSLAVGLSFGAISFVMMSVSTLGAVAEAAMAVTADLNEVIEQDAPTHAQLGLQAEIIGRQILGTAVNTLFFGVLGANLPLVIWYVRLGYTWSAFLNSKMLMAELATLLLGMLGIGLAIWLSQFWILKSYKKENA